MKHLLSLRGMTCLAILWFVSMVLGYIPRESALLVAAVLALWIWVRPLGDGVALAVRLTPFWVALPFTSGFDSLTMWRPLALVLLARAFADPSLRSFLSDAYRSFRNDPVQWLKRRPFLLAGIALVILALASVLVAAYPMIALKRIIYFANASMIPLVVYGAIRTGKRSAAQLIGDIAIPTMLVVAVGYLQLASTYLIDIYAFMRIWGEGIQLRQFGSQWSHIAVWVGNTWFAYYGSQLSLRVFSLFPDSHSFPSFVLFGIPALMTVALAPIVAQTRSAGATLARIRARMSILWVPAAFLIAILSGTRGIWAAGLGTAVLALAGIVLLRRFSVEIYRRRLFTHIASYLTVFFLLFALAWPIFISPQFLLGKGDWGMFGSRIKSIVDFGETSNSQRIAIWKASLVSIGKHPLLGIGIGNFPVVLDQNIALARAGSTAHNLYLHIAAEMGVPAAIIAIGILLSSWIASIRWFLRAPDTLIVYPAMLTLILPWFFAYVLTDPILFDERIFLAWGYTLALILAARHES